MSVVSDDGAESSEQREALQLYSVRLGRDQITFLRTLQNASEWIRCAIDEKRMRESTASTENRVILLSQEIKDVRNQVEAVKMNPNYVEAKHGLQESQLQQQRLEEPMVTLRTMNERPEYLMPRETPIRNAGGTIVGAMFSVAIPNLEGGQEKVQAETRDELLKNVRAKTAQNLTDLAKRKSILAQEEAKRRVIINGFEEEIRALETKRRSLEEELLQAGSATEGAAVP